MSDAIENEIYQEVYAIRSRIDSLDVRSQLNTVISELNKINAQLAGLSKAAGVVQDIPGEGGGRSKGLFGFLR